MKLIALMAITVLAICAAQAAPAQTEWKLVWQDEFNGKAGAPPDATKWTHELGGGGWGNNELEFYTHSTSNCYQDGQGNLVIKAIREKHIGRDYTSARIKTEGQFSQEKGRFEARIKIPGGQGIWPAFWLLGEDISTAGWPGCGELDILENIGKEPNTVHGSVHGPGYDTVGSFSLPAGEKFADKFHVYGMDWDADKITFSVDNSVYSTVLKSSLKPDQRWVFDHPFFIILNLAVGGNWPGSPDATTVFPQSMLVDWVRVYSAR